MSSREQTKHEYVRNFLTKKKLTLMEPIPFPGFVILFKGFFVNSALLLTREAARFFEIALRTEARPGLKKKQTKK